MSGLFTHFKAVLQGMLPVNKALNKEWLSWVKKLVFYRLAKQIYKLHSDEMLLEKYN
ncbi:MAG: hypothetical protein ACI9C4_002505 [Paraglaciecola sp.]